MTAPAWLPPTVNVNGEPDKVFVMLYGIFDADIRRGGRQFLTMPVWWDRRVIDPPYEEGFWHLITRKDHAVGERLLDFRRAERLPWCGPVISNCGDHCVRVWDYQEGDGRVRIYLWLEQYDYVIILERKAKRLGMVAFLGDGLPRRRSAEAGRLGAEISEPTALKLQTPPFGGVRSPSTLGR